jgi:hypothetical protein
VFSLLSFLFLSSFLYFLFPFLPPLFLISFLLFPTNYRTLFFAPLFRSTYVFLPFINTRKPSGDKASPFPDKRKINVYLNGLNYTFRLNAFNCCN